MSIVDSNPGSSPFTGWVVFSVSAPDLNPELITNILQIEPDRIVHPQDERSGEWQINSRLEAQRSLSAHIWDLLDRLKEVRHELRRIQTEATLEFYCSVEKLPGASILFDLSPRMLLLIGHLGACIRMDISDLNASHKG